MPKEIYRTAIYCRLSREDGDKVESNSIASQRAICEDFISRHDDLEMVCEPFVDDGYSGVSFNRPSFKKLEDAIRKGAIASWSRISAAFQETTLTVAATLRRFFLSLVSDLLPSTMPTTVSPAIRSLTPLLFRSRI